MNQFKILAHGENFDVDLFLSTTTLRPSSVWHKGQSSPDHRQPLTSGFDVILGDGKALDVFAQQRIAIDYIQSNLDVLKSLGECPGMEPYIVFIQQRMDITLAVVGFCTTLSKELLTLTTAIKMDAMTYVDLNRLDRQECGWPPEHDT